MRVEKFIIYYVVKWIGVIANAYLCKEIVNYVISLRINDNLVVNTLCCMHTSIMFYSQLSPAMFYVTYLSVILFNDALVSA